MKFSWGGGGGGEKLVNLATLPVKGAESRSRIHEHTISLRFLGIILRVLRLEVSVYNVYITNQFPTTIVPITSKNSASAYDSLINIRGPTRREYNLEKKFSSNQLLVMTDSIRCTDSSFSKHLFYALFVHLSYYEKLYFT